jgi:hypothetical protein
VVQCQQASILQFGWGLTALHRKMAACYKVLCKTADLLDLVNTVMIFGLHNKTLSLFTDRVTVRFPGNSLRFAVSYYVHREEVG